MPQIADLSSFNTQPPEGGWDFSADTCIGISRFNTQPPEGGWLYLPKLPDPQLYVSTHSRPKAAGPFWVSAELGDSVSTHSRPKAAGGIVVLGYQYR